jgi:hypothetical protein
MNKRWRRFLVIGVLVAVVVAVALVPWALRWAPTFYRLRLARAAANQRDHSDQFLKKAAGLSNASRRSGTWHMTVSEDEINGWLAVDLEQNQQRLLPPHVHEPRVDLRPGRIALAFRDEGGMFPVIVSLECDVSLPEENVLQIGVVRGRAGFLPLPLHEILEEIATAGRQSKVQVDWRRSGDTPIAVFDLNHALLLDDWRTNLTALRIEEDRLVLSGNSLPRTEDETARTGNGGPTLSWNKIERNLPRPGK